jgi:tetratricopeptide (TPR) repeat protein
MSLVRRQPKDLPQRQDIWHAMIVQLRIWIAEPGKKPVRPQGLIILSLTEGRIAGLEIAETPTSDWVREMLFKVITRPAQGTKPHRPQTITLADPAWVAALTPALSEIGVACQQMDTPIEVQGIVADLESHMRGDRPEVPGLLSVKGATPEIVGDLFAAAAEFYRAAPWIQLTNTQALAVQIPAQAAPRYISVMGNAGVEYGLSVSLAWQDLEFMVSGAVDDPMEIIPESGAHSMLFNSIVDTSFDDVDAAEQYHWQVVSDQAFPVPVIFDRRKGALRPDRAELLWYQAALRAIPIFVRDHLRPDGRGDYAPAEASIEVPSSEGPVMATIRYPAGKLDRAAEPVAQMDWPDEEGETPFFDRRMMEGQLAAMTGQMGESFLDDPQLRQAQELMYQAWEERNPARRISLAHEALTVSPDCTDAYVLLAEEEADTVGRALEHYQQGVAAGERALKGKWEESIGYFWGILETRPYMRARHGLADTLWRLERREEARSHFEEMLRLNPNDNQGIRYLLAQLLLEMDLDADLDKLLNQYRDEGTAAWLYTRALIEFRQGGATDKANKALHKALRQNRHVPSYLTGQERIPNRLPDHIGWGDENEAVAFAADHLNHWRRTEGAVAWLQDQLTASASAQSAKPAKAKGPTLDQVIESLLAEVDEPVALDDLVQEVLARKPSKAKNPVQAVTNHVRNSYRQQSYAFLDRQTIVPLRVAFQGARFRVTLDRQMASEGAVRVYPYFVPFLRHGTVRIQPEATPTFVNDQGHEIPTRLTTVRVKSQELMGALAGGKVDAIDLKSWLNSAHAQRGDSLLLTVLDWERSHFQLALEPERRRRKTEIAQQNRALADVLYELLKATHDESLFVERGLQAAFARLSSVRDYPGDHWATVIERDGRMRWQDFEIVAADSERLSLADLVFDEPEEEAVEEKPFTAKQGKQVYRFRASRGKKTFVVEAQGKNTLGDLDAVMREAFDRDPFDHLSEFTLIAPRGKGNQPRRQPCGPLDPLGEYAAHKVRLAGLGLEPGAQLEYVYDFGEGLEHALVLEAIEEPEKGAEYPRFQ